MRTQWNLSALPLYPDVGFIDAIAFVSAFQVSAAVLVPFRSVDLDPAPDTTGVNEQTTFERHTHATDTQFRRDAVV